MAERSILTDMQPVLGTHTRIERLRALPRAGTVLVRQGDRLEPYDVIARYPAEERIIALDIAGLLQVSIDAAARHLKVQPGESVEPDTVVAARRRGTLGTTRVLAGRRGKVIGLQEGSLFIEQAPEWLPVRAYIPGQVHEIIPGLGVVMQTTGSVLRGIWGTGGEAMGLLSVEVDSPGAPLVWSRVTAQQAGMVLVGGTLQSNLLLQRAAHYGVAGIIVGSVHPDLCGACRRAPFPVIMTEGTGHMPMATPVFELLRQRHHSQTILAGDSRLTDSGPEVIFPLRPDLPSETPATSRLQVGSLVRLTGLSRLGSHGEVVSLPTEPRESASGVMTLGAEVRLEDRRLIFVPLTNLELITPRPADTSNSLDLLR